MGGPREQHGKDVLRGEQWQGVDQWHLGTDEHGEVSEHVIPGQVGSGEVR
jgi:hypothetical protein